MNFGNLFGRKRGGLSGEAKKELQRQRDLYQQALAIMINCQTKKQIIEGFEEIASIAEFRNPDLARAAAGCADSCRTLTMEYVRKLRYDQIRVSEAFLSSTEKYLH